MWGIINHGIKGIHLLCVLLLLQDYVTLPLLYYDSSATEEHILLKHKNPY